jgi:Kdo2-lipid IVA lauroyltransferase/acyltransferase
MKYRFKHVLEYALVRALSGLLNHVPYRAALLFGWILARVAFHVIRFRRREAERRIREVFAGRLTPREVRRVAWDSLRNLFFTAVEIMRGPSMTLKWFQATTSYEAAAEVLRREFALGHGAIAACPHMGSWELAGAGAVLLGIPVFTIAGKQRNPLFDAYLLETRTRMGFDMSERGSGTMRTVIRNLRDGKFFAMLPDVRMPTPALRVKFLGREANIGTGMALFARHADAPICPIVNTRRGWARHVVRAYPPIRPDPEADKDADVQRMTQAVFDVFSEAILAEPGQWFWYNKRWIFDPVEVSPREPPTSENG